MWQMFIDHCFLPKLSGPSQRVVCRTEGLRTKRFFFSISCCEFKFGFLVVLFICSHLRGGCCFWWSIPMHSWPERQIWWDISFSSTVCNLFSSLLYIIPPLGSSIGMWTVSPPSSLGRSYYCSLFTWRTRRICLHFLTRALHAWDNEMYDRAQFFVFVVESHYTEMQQNNICVSKTMCCDKGIELYNKYCESERW